MSNEPQANITKVLRPPSNYQTLYAGTNPSVQPIYLYPDGVQRDEMAGRTGYDPNLVNALRVPLGAQLEIWLPNLGATLTDEPLDIVGYRWVLQFRLRNVSDFKQARKAYHLPVVTGTPDTTSGSPEPRVVIPGAYTTLLYFNSVSVPVGDPDAGRGVNNLRAEDVVAQATQFNGPIVAPGVEGAFQQGVANPATTPSAIRPGWLTWQVPAHGDELLLGVFRPQGEEGAGDTWDFGDVDRQLRNFFLNTAVGAYVTVGTADGFLTQRNPGR